MPEKPMSSIKPKSVGIVADDPVSAMVLESLVGELEQWLARARKEGRTDCARVFYYETAVYQILQQRRVARAEASAAT